MNFDPVPIRRPREQVETQLRSAIIEGTFKNGDRLPSEMDLASRFNVSRTTIREALRSLANEGLLRKIPGASGGSFVTAVDHNSLSTQIKDGVSTVLRLGTVSMPEILQVRNFLEIPASGLAAQSISNAHLDVLRNCIDDVKNLELGDPRVAEIDAQFHSVIASASENRMLSAFVCALHDATRPANYLHFTEADGRETVLQHIAIVRALSRGDANEAQKAMREHLEYLERMPVNPQYADHHVRNPITV